LLRTRINVSPVPTAIGLTRGNGSAS
jgi:hypothetical protein